LTESCDPDLPHLITNVETTPATTSDEAVTPLIHVSLQARDLLPSMHFADTGFIDAELMVVGTRGGPPAWPSARV
jgi:transposase